ncbi:hypothetical protein M4I21_05145 [Cellulophaga sp. 20_2_10]|uniref:hypothetical protein n=1 Tax=Cellulophaga sp. 20_2_10 TaxID=2942476 RepID=UPI00201AEA7B|nr:hypothetical protein [Cellulophaga sp. 20_2_10]MCL5245184.1 hypothetical protein [Cellulophaga sp. 20_2_10]
MKLIYKIILGIFVCFIITLYWLSNITEGEYYRHHSPDGQYSIYASKAKYFNFPFSSFGDVRGKVHLYDELENKLISSSSIDMISYVDGDFFWNEDELYMKAKTYIKLPRKINTKIIDAYEKSVPVKYNWNLYMCGNEYVVNKERNRLTVSDKNGEILLQNIQYISQIGNSFQVLNNRTEIEYYDAGLNKLKNAPDIKIKCYEVCGNVTTYGLKIEEKNNYFVIKKAVGFTNYNFNNYTAIDSISKTKVKDIYFLNKKREFTYDENIIKQDIVIINFKTYFGIWSEKYGIEYFDTIDLKNNPIKVMRNELYGYYNMTSTSYLKLESFKYNLARFEKKDTSGKKRNGYVTREGNYFYDYR